jgi:hypothetical protein
MKGDQPASSAAAERGFRATTAIDSERAEIAEKLLADPLPEMANRTNRRLRRGARRRRQRSIN